MNAFNSNSSALSLPWVRSLRPRTKVVIAMSGGVDSSAAAAMLLQAGHEVIGVTMSLKGCPEDTGEDPCGADETVQAARAVARALKIPHHVLDCSGQFSREVLRCAWEEYDCGRTPSPCLRCNEGIKFGTLLDWAINEAGATCMATGHYVRLRECGDGSRRLLRSLNRQKDQSYFLAGLDSGRLSRLVFPLGDMTKEQVRGLAARLDLPSARVAESQDTCIGCGDLPFAEYLRRRFQITAQPGPIVLAEDGREIGRHQGVHLFTIGQRRALPINIPRRTWVKAINPATREVVVTHDDASLYSSRFTVRGLSGARFSSSVPPDDTPLDCVVKVRSQHRAVLAKLKVNLADRSGEVELEDTVKSVTPGQAAVFYGGDEGEEVWGRGWIDQARE